MPEVSKVNILLADEDALRRDGLAAVLAQNPALEIVAGVPDGEQALQEIRALRPDVAVIDLNLPLLHGIELVRRVRGEALGTKIIILASTDNDDIVREVVRAGGDAYLLKNGPARHLIDAISYVRDGGQYFSPQLKRDGRDRHLLEEPPRVPPERAYREEREYSERPRSASGGAPRSRRANRRINDPSQFRERIREEVSESGMADRDYEIMSMMAEGIRPILDRLDEIDSRVSSMETGEEALPQDPRAWITSQLAETLGRRGGAVATSRDVADIEASLPKLIEEAVTQRFHEMAGKLQEEIEETHVRTLETFVRSVQTKLVNRVSALEQDMSTQAEAMVQLQEYSQRTEDNLSRLISGVDKLAKDLPRRLAAPAAPADDIPEVHGEPETGASPASAPSRAQAVRRRRSPPTGSGALIKKIWVGTAAAALLAICIWTLVHFVSRSETATGAPPAPTAKQVAAQEKARKREITDNASRIQAAKEAMDREEYPVAEDLFRQVTKTEPNNSEALQGLASALFREGRMDEATQILDKLPAKN